MKESILTSRLELLKMLNLSTACYLWLLIRICKPFMSEIKHLNLNSHSKQWHFIFVVFFFFLNKFIYLFFFLAALGLCCCTGFLQLRWAGATLHCGVWASHCGGFSCCRAWALGAWASVVAARGLSSCGSWALEHRLSSGGARA